MALTEPPTNRIRIQILARYIQSFTGLQPIHDPLSNGTSTGLHLLSPLRLHQRHRQVIVLGLQQRLTTAIQAALADGDNALVIGQPESFFGWLMFHTSDTAAADGC